MKHRLCARLLAFLLAIAAMRASAAGQPGEVKGAMLVPNPANLAIAWDNANLVLPSALVGGQRREGMPAAAPRIAGQAPLVILLHGSSGIAPAVKEFQNWLADGLGLASVAPDSRDSRPVGLHRLRRSSSNALR